MVAAPSTLSTDRPGGLRAILWGGLIAGALDITYAIVFSYLRSNVSPIVILQSVASGLLGANSYNGGFATAALGLFLHFLIAYMWAAVYYAASRKLDLLVRVPYVCGVVYGLLIYVVMNYVVLPLSAVPPRQGPRPTLVLVTGLLIHMLGIGLPIALATRRYSK
ncbi:MAG: hypothetical protein ACJ74Q_04275 [Pyrinomonadaceae bacterium]